MFQKSRFLSLAFALALAPSQQAFANAAAQKIVCAGLFSSFPSAPTVLSSSNFAVKSRTFDTAEGDVKVYGSATALQSVGPEVLLAKPLKEILVPNSEGGIITATAITGSITRTTSLKTFGDVDMEAILVSKVAPGRAASLTDPSSHEVVRLTKFFQDHVVRTAETHPELLFVELKAGEFVDPQSGETKGVKWSLDEIRAGKKAVIDIRGARTLTLAQALVEPGRVKCDWAAPSIAPGSLPGAYQEITVLYRFGVQVGENDVRLRPIAGGNREALPFRNVSIAFDPIEARIQQQASRVERSMPIEAIHRDMLQFTADDLNTNLIKFVKRVYAFLKFWPDQEGFAWKTGSKATNSKLTKQAIELLTDAEVLRLSQLRTQAKEFLELGSRGFVFPGNAEATWLASNPRSFPGGVKEAKDHYEQALQRRVEELLRAKPELRLYVDYQIDQIRFASGGLSSQPLFVTALPDAKWLSSYQAYLVSIMHTYPNLDFAPMSAVRADLVSLGMLTPSSTQEIQAHVTALPSGFVGLRTGGFVLSKDGSTVFLRLHLSSIEGREALSRLRAKSVASGARPASNQPINSIDIPVAVAKAWKPEGLVELGDFIRNESFGTADFDIGSIEIKP